MGSIGDVVPYTNKRDTVIPRMGIFTVHIQHQSGCQTIHEHCNNN